MTKGVSVLRSDAYAEAALQSQAFSTSSDPVYPLLLHGLHPAGDAAKPPPQPPRSPPRPPSPPKPPSPPPNLRNKNGVRLVGGSGPRGRLEVASRNAWFSPPGGKVGWSPVCDSPDFTDETAQNMCIMLGYKYGRKYYSLETAYLNLTNVNETRSPPYSVGKIYCQPNSAGGRRRLLRNPQQSGGGVHNPGSDPVLAGGSRSAHPDRSLYSVTRSLIASPAAAPFTCYFYTGGPCEANGPLAGVECSHFSMLPAPPPPPSPPLPPPALSASIRMVGGPGVNMMPRWEEPYGITESNLCAAAADLCPMFGRFDLQVASPDGSGTKVWAPLCAPQDPDLAEAIGSIACGQVYDWPKGYDGGVEIVLSATSQTAFPIPEPGAVLRPGDFDPAAAPGWVTVTGASKPPIISVQDFDYTVTTEPCSSGGLLAVSCQAWGETRRRG